MNIKQGNNHVRSLTALSFGSLNVQHKAERIRSNTATQPRIGILRINIPATIPTTKDTGAIIISRQPLLREQIFCSKGATENSPAFQCRDKSEKYRVPQGRLKQNINRPCGTRLRRRQTPAFKRRAIFKASLRDAI